MYARKSEITPIPPKQVMRQYSQQRMNIYHPYAQATTSRQNGSNNLNHQNFNYAPNPPQQQIRYNGPQTSVFMLPEHSTPKLTQTPISHYFQQKKHTTQVTQKAHTGLTDTNFPMQTHLMPVQKIDSNNRNKIIKTTQKENHNTEMKNNFATSENNEVDPITLTGTVERAIKWHKVQQNYTHYEIIASVIGFQDSFIRGQKVMLLRDTKGPVLQVTYFTSDHINIDNFYIGQILRCVGTMVGSNIFRAYSIRNAKPDEIASLRRLTYICDHAVSRAITQG